MISIISTRRFARWTQKFKAWLSDKFSSISVDLTPLEEDIADVKSDVADVKDAVENIDLSSVAKQKALQELYCPNNHANLIKWNNIWLVSTGVQYGGFIIYNNVDVTGTEFYVGAASNPQVGGVLYRATATTIDFSQQLSGSITEVKQIKLSTILDLIGTPASEQASTLFGAIAEGSSGGGGSERLEQFFGLPEALPQYHAMTTAEVLEIADEEWLAMYGFVAVPNTLHTVNPLGQQVTIATYFKPSRTYGDYGFPELWAQNDQQQWVSILNDHPTADRDIYTYNPSNNE